MDSIAEGKAHKVIGRFDVAGGTTLIPHYEILHWHRQLIQQKMNISVARGIKRDIVR